MSDLISRSKCVSKLVKALDALNKEYKEAMLYEDYELISAIRNQKSAYTIALRVLDNQPTDYDVDKVVEKLETTKETACELLKIPKFLKKDLQELVNMCFDEAIEIVKHGVVSDDVCEWHCDVYGRWHTECHILADNDPLEYTYCPYCGKRIKVVE